MPPSLWRLHWGLSTLPYLLTIWIFAGAWLVINSALWFGRGPHTDPYPYIVANLFLLLLAGVNALAGAIASLLVAATRSDSMATALAGHMQENTMAIKELTDQNARLVELLLEQLTLDD